VKIIRKLLLAAAVLALLSIVVAVLVRWKFTTVAKLDAGNGFQIHVIADTFWHIDPVRAYYYEVHRGPDTVVDMCFVSSWPTKGAFELRTTKDRTLAALVLSSNPDIVLALYDTSSGATWPQSGDSEFGRTLLARLQQSHPDAKFVLTVDATGSQFEKL
jgi:hypothetical protein